MRRLAFRAALLVLAAALALAPHAGAAERTGEVLRELLKGVDEALESLEKQKSGFAARHAQLTRTLQEKRQAFLSESDPGKQHALRAGAYEAAAQLNAQDRKEVELTLRAIGDVRDKLGRIRGVLEDSGIVPRREDRARFQKDLGRWGKSVAGLLEAWSDRVGPEAKAEFDALKRSLAGAFGAWEAPAGRGGGEDLQRTVRTLDLMYSQLITLQRSLEVEKTQLQLRNQQALLELIILRLGTGSTNVPSLGEAVGAKQRDVQQRQRLVDDLEGGAASAGVGKSAPGLRGDDAARFERIKRGDFNFGGK